MTEASKRPEAVAARGARWFTVALIIVGMLNYGYSLILTRLLNVGAYAGFAAAQSLILWATTLATVSVPWVLAQGMARARSDEERGAAVRFAKLASAGGGFVGAIVVGLIATRFGGLWMALTAGLSTFVIFLGTATTGWLQGQQRMGALSGLLVCENVVKNLAGLVLVLVVGLRGIGAIAAFGIGGLVILLRWPRAPEGRGGAWRAAMANRRLWRRTVIMASVQGMVSLFIVLNVVLVELLPGDRALAASYQASSSVSRVPMFIAGAVATAFFPSLSRRTHGGMIAARALQMYTAVGLPVAAVLMTMPPSLLTLVFPAQYGAMAMLLRFTAVAGLCAGGISLVTAFFQATDDYSCLWPLVAGVTVYAAALLAGWRIGGIEGLAAGAATGCAVTLLLLGYRLVRREGRGLLARLPVIEGLAAAALLLLVRQFPAVWLLAAALLGLRACGRFIRPTARHARRMIWAMPRRQETGERRAASLLTDTVWREKQVRASDAELTDALALARHNRVEGCLARAYPEELADVLAELRAADQLHRRYLHQVTDLLGRAGIPAVLVQDHRRTDHVCRSIDLIVSERHWHAAVNVLAGWLTYHVVDQLEGSERAMFYPQTGPVLALRTGRVASGVPGLPADGLIARAHRAGDGILVPAASDDLRIRLSRAVFQDRTLDLGLMLALRDLIRPEVVTAARAEADREGWRATFDNVLARAGVAMDCLDRGTAVELPLPLGAPLPVKTQTYTASHARRPKQAPSAEDETAANRVLVAAYRGE